MQEGAEASVKNTSKPRPAWLKAIFIFTRKSEETALERTLQPTSPFINLLSNGHLPVINAGNTGACF
jgi:hypothetical protein